MDNKLYKMMNWPEIESVIYSECDHPHEILGKHSFYGGTLIQCYFPGAVSVHLVGNDFPFVSMEEVDEEGFFVYWTNNKSIGDYHFEVTYNDKSKIICEDIYNYLPTLDKNQLDKFNAATFYDIYRYFGAHECTIKDKRGVSFLVYAPDVTRISVVGDFNNWDGRTHQMSKISDIGIFSIFIPELPDNFIYKYEIKLKSGITFLKRDPFSFEVEKEGGHASIYSVEPYFSWSDTKFMSSYSDVDEINCPVSLGEICISDLKSESKTTKEMIEIAANYAKDNHFSALVFDNISKNHQTGNTYCPYCQSDINHNELKNLVNGLHEKNVSVFFTLDLSSFMPDDEGLKGFCGNKKLYESNDYVIDNQITYNYKNTYVRNYLISNVFYYIDVFHADGFVLRGVDRILYLNYKISDDNYEHNIYGGNENPDGEEFIKHINSIIHKKYPEVVTIAGDSLNSNCLTQITEDGGFGFDYKFDNYFHKSVLEYFKSNQNSRNLHYPNLVNLLVNAFCEEYILMMPRAEYGDSEALLIDDYLGSTDEKYSNFRLMMATFFCMPGRKSIPFINIKDKDLKEYICALGNLYNYNPALFELGNSENSFKWLQNMDSAGNTLCFQRFGEKQNLLIVCNFSNVEKDIELSMDKECVFQEIFNSNLCDFGGNLELSAELLNFEDKKVIVKAQPLTVHVYTEIFTKTILDFSWN